MHTSQSARQRLVGAALLCLAVATPMAAAQDGAPAAADFARMPKPWLTPPNRPSLDEYVAALEHWSHKHPALMTLERRAESREGLPVFLVKITDSSVPDDDKLVVLSTALHSGAERTGGTANLHLIEWLLGSSALARETRRRQVVLVMPICNPYGFFLTESSFNADRIDAYTGLRGRAWDLKSLTLREAAKAPEIAAFMSVVDEYRPDVHTDLHGVALHYNGHLVAATVGPAGSNSTLRPWDWRITEAMIAAGQRAGYGYWRMECDAQRLFGGGPLEALGDFFWFGRPLFYTALYAYVKCHTMPITQEVGWEQAGVEAVKGLLALGNRGFGAGPIRGYPVDLIKCGGLHALCAYGVTAAARRQSRVELWQRQGAVAIGELYPRTDCREMLVCAIGEISARTLFAGAGVSGRWGRIGADALLENLSRTDHVLQDHVRAFVDAGPPSQRKILFERSSPAAREAAPALRHGVAFQLKISYAAPEILDLRLNGRLLRQSATDGWQRWYDDGYTHLRINVPPGKAAKWGVYIVTCAYKPDVARTYGWRAPREVLERLRK